MDILKNLRSKGYRITPQRQEVLKAIYGHPHTVDEIYESLKNKDINVDLASVYRAIQMFVDNRIIQEVQFGDNKKRYELLNENNHHHHLICNNCGTVKDISLENEKYLLKEVSSSSDFKITKHSLEFFGLCKDCQ